MLLNYSFNIEYINTKDFGQLDALSPSHLFTIIDTGGLPLRKTHPGQTKMKMLARSFVYWPTMDSDIEKLVKTDGRTILSTYRGRLIQVAGNRPDVFDLYYPRNEVHLCQVWKSKDARHGQRNTVHVVSVNSILPFLRNLAHSHAAVPSTKQRTSRMFCGHLPKRGLAKLKGEEPTLDALQTFLMVYRSTLCPSAPDQRSPAEAFLGRQLRTEINLMLLSRDRTNGTRDLKMESQFNRRNGTRRRNFEMKVAIFARDYRGQKPTWTPGFIIRRVGNIAYTVRFGNEVWTRHVNQLRSRIGRTATNTFLDVFDLPLLDPASRDHDATLTADSSQRPQPLRQPGVEVAALSAELEEAKTALDNAIRARRQAEIDLEEANGRIADLTAINNNLTSIKNKLETELSTVQADLDEVTKELHAADEGANRALADAARVVEQLHEEQEHSMKEAEAAALLGGKRVIAKLETRIRDLETALDEETRRHKETQNALRKKDRRIKEIQQLVDEEHKNFVMAQDTADRLQEKLNIQKTQFAEAVRISDDGEPAESETIPARARGCRRTCRPGGIQPDSRQAHTAYARKPGQKFLISVLRSFAECRCRRQPAEKLP
ncbi:hypothetical protein RB195_004452 [Necator americanus]|uniref:RNA-directed DNA polymerase n=1 Tax=Necator americanus TaxID=51031 RepID=A0ABR1BLH8_NECAM